MEVSAENKALAQYLRALLGGSPKFFRHADPQGRSSVAVMSVTDAPWEGVNTHATIGLSDLDQQLSLDGLPLRAELLMACAATREFGANIVATCAFEAMNDGAPIRPDAVLRNVVREYYPGSSMAHVLLHNPYLWNIETQRFDSKVVAWLLTIPISDSEASFVQGEGVPALARLFEKQQIDIFDFDRPSVVN